MNTTVWALHKFDEARLAEVMAEMERLGAPTIRAVDVAGYLMAIEGTHRLEAARRLGLTPVVEVVAGADADNAEVITGLDIDDRAEWTVGELRDLWPAQQGECYDAELA